MIHTFGYLQKKGRDKSKGEAGREVLHWKIRPCFALSVPGYMFLSPILWLFDIETLNMHFKIISQKDLWDEQAFVFVKRSLNTSFTQEYAYESVRCNWSIGPDISLWHT